jgi:hypothetical protein
MSSTDGAALTSMDRENEDALVKIDVGRAVGSDFVPMANDVVRMVCIQAAIQMMLVLSSGGNDGVSFFSAEFMLLVFYIALGVMLYWLAVRKLVLFV